MRRTILVLFLLIVVSAADRAAAQTPDGAPDPANVRIRLGPVWMSPRLELTNLGVDTNVFNEPDSANPKKDFTATVTPSTDLWLRMGRSWLQLNIREDLVWYQKYSTERAANTSYRLSWKMRLNRLFVTVAPDYLHTRDRPGFEIDTRPPRTEYGGKADVEVRALARTYLALNGSWRRVDFDKDAMFDERNLQFELDRTVTEAGVSLRHHLTPLTAIALNVGRSQDRFEFSPLRDSNSTGVSGSVSFDPHALLKGGASFGYRDFEPLSPGVPAYKGITTTGDLAYTLLGMTRFAVQFRRDVSYSYDVNQPYYLESGVGASIAQQIYGPVDVVGRVNASRLAYRDRTGATIEVPDRVDYVRLYGVGVGYRMSSGLRIGFNLDHQHRISDVADRQYNGLKYGTSVTYAF